MRSVAGFLFTSVLLSAASIPSPVSRASIVAMEKSFDKRIDLIGLDDPFGILGTTRGVYLDGYGVVFTTELNLVQNAVLSPFRPAYTKEDLHRLRLKKLARLEALKKNMREMLVSSAASLDGVPAEEKIVLGINLFYYSWEDSAGLPRQVIMKAPKKALLEAMHGKTSDLDSSLNVQELN
jgi:hypothetical protein